MSLFGKREPSGYTLRRADMGVALRIRGDQVDPNMLVIVHQGVPYVRLGERDDDGFEIYREGHLTHVYRSHGE